MKKKPWKTYRVTPGTRSINVQPLVLTELEIETGIDQAPTVNCLIKLAPPEKALGTIILFSSGRQHNKPITPTRFEYWSHASKLPSEYNYIFVSDPTLKTRGNRLLTYGIHKDFDGIEVMVAGIKKILQLHKIEPHHLRFFGFSQGGFFALQIASFFDASKVLLHCPSTYGLHEAISATPQIIEEALDNQYTLEEYAEEFPMNHWAWARMKNNQRIPEIELHTNRRDVALFMGLEFTEQILNADPADFKEIGTFNIKATATHLYHLPYPLDEWIASMQKFLPTQTAEQQAQQ